VVTDPTFVAVPERGALARIALRTINDERDLPFLRLMALLSALLIPAAVYIAWPGNFRWWMAPPYLATIVFFVGPYILMLHNTSHRRLFNRRFGFMNHYIPWVLGPLFGESPETYFAHHVGMHHPENNLEDDLSSTMKYQRDSFLDFMRYFLRFFFLALPDLATYFVRTKRPGLARRAVGGELLFFAAAGALAYVSWQGSLVVLVAPFVMARFGMMAGNWGQHAFIDAATPESCYRNSITCINCTYNRRCFNDGYHIGHHIKQTRHWTEMPPDFLANKQTYYDERAIVFEGIDFFMVWLFLMLKRYDWLAKRYVHLGPESERKSLAEIEALLRERTRQIPARVLVAA